MNSHFSGQLQTALKRAAVANHRQLLWLSGKQAWCYQQLLSVDKQIATLNTLVVGQKSQFASFFQRQQGCSLLQRIISQKDCYKQLGTEKQLVVFDCYSGINPDNLAQVSGTLAGGGVLILITPSINDWDDWAEHELNNLWVQPYTVEDVTRHFLKWLSQCLVTDKHLLHFCELKQNELCNSLVLANVEEAHASQRFKGEGYPADNQTSLNTLAIEQQVSVVDGLSEYLSACVSGCGVLTAARGRGKSAALGMLVNQLSESLSVYLTASDKLAVHQVEKFSHQTIQFSQVSQLLAAKIDTQTSLLIIDEAASISVELLLKLVVKFPRVVLATTTEGYEGTGQGFKLKFLDSLTNKQFNYKHFTLEQPMRWAAQDPLESWLNKLLFLNHPAQNTLQGSQCSEPNKCLAERVSGAFAIEKITGEALIQQPDLLQALFSLLSQAHYRTTPGDLRVLLDSPNMHIWLAFDCTLKTQQKSNSLVCACLAACEGAIAQFDPDHQGMDGEALAVAMYRGLRRPRGNLLPQILIAQEGILAAKNQRFVRVVRIATRLDRRCEGVAGQLLERVSQWAAKNAFDYIGANFSLETKLLEFWNKQQFNLVRIGSQLDSVTASYSATVIKPLNEDSFLHKKLQTSLHCRLSFLKLRAFDNSLTDETTKLVKSMTKRVASSQALRCNNTTEFSWEQEQLACFAYYHRPLASVGHIFTQQLNAFPHLWLSKGLKKDHSLLLKDYFFSDKSLSDIYSEHGLINYKALQKKMRLIAKAIIESSAVSQS